MLFVPLLLFPENRILSLEPTSQTSFSHPCLFFWDPGKSPFQTPHFLFSHPLSPTCTTGQTFFSYPCLFFWDPGKSPFQTPHFLFSHRLSPTCTTGQTFFSHPCIPQHPVSSFGSSRKSPSQILHSLFTHPTLI